MRPLIKSANFLITVFLCVAGVVSAQEAKSFFDEHQYTRAIQALLGKSADLSGLSDVELYLLGGAHMRRGYFLRDLAALQALAGRDYYFGRDTSKAAKPLAWTPYFLGRYLFELGQYEQALRALQRAGRNTALSKEYIGRSQIWIGACQHRLGKATEAANSWKNAGATLAGELAYARARLGQKSEANCGAASGVPASRCRLWSVARPGVALAELNKLQAALLNAAAADVEQRIDADYTQKFYDPATPLVLAHADFIAASEAFSRVKDPKGLDQANYFAGVCAFEAGEYERARAFLQKTGMAQRDIYLGGLDYLNNQREAAEQKWRPLQNANVQTALEWAEVASRFSKKPEAIMEVYQKYQTTASDKMDLALRLGRALLQIGRYDEAVELLETAYPALYRDKLRHIEPAYLITLACAKYRLKARYYAQEILGHINGVCEAYPAARTVYDLAQGVFTPTQIRGDHW